MTTRPDRIAIVVSHPIQHFVPLYRGIAARPNVQVKVFYASRIGLEAYFDEHMGVEIKWDMDLLSGYESVFLDKADAIDSVSFSSINSSNLHAELSSFDPDSVMIYGYVQANCWRAMAWARRRRKRVLMISDSELLHQRSRIRQAAKTLAVRTAYRFVDCFLSVGDNNEAHYRYYGVHPDRIFRSPFTIDEARFEKEISNRDSLRAAKRSELGLPADAIIALFVGKMTARKRPRDLLDAVEKVNLREDRQIHVIFAGDGVLRDELIDRAVRQSLDVSFPGFVNLDALPSLYIAADLLVHPADSDPHPLVCSEAAIAGLPMVLSDAVGASGPSDVAREGENALLFPVGDVEALAVHLAKLATDPSLRSAMGQRSQEIFSELDLERSVDGICRAMRADLDSSHGARR